MDIEIFRQAYRDVSMYTLRQTFVSCDRRLTERPVAPAVDEAILDVHRSAGSSITDPAGPPQPPHPPLPMRSTGYSSAIAA